MPFDGDRLAAAFLHDPPDKPLLIASHVGRSRRYADALGVVELPGPEADQLASAVERLPSPRPGGAYERAVGPAAGRLTIVHPLSGQSWELTLPAVDEAATTEPLAAWRDLRPRERFLALWRLWPDALAGRHPAFDHLPADTRCPDHTIWHHLDVVSALAADGAGDRTFLSFSVGPVQPFIAAARTVRDLWSGSMILSYLTFRALLPVVEDAGPGAVLFPSLRGLPLFDQWLREQRDLVGVVPAPGPVAIKSPCLPNRFVAVVGRRAGAELVGRCQRAAREAWDEIAGAVKQDLDAAWQFAPAGWDRLWRTQVGGYFDFRTALLPWNEADERALANLLRGARTFGEAFPDARAARGLVEAMPPGDRPSYAQDWSIGMWQHRLEMAARLEGAGKAVRHYPPDTPADGSVPNKCSLLGSFEQMGPADIGESRQFWAHASREPVAGIRVGRRDRFCAVSLVKRLCGSVFFEQALGLDRLDLRFPDTATVAARRWLDETGLEVERQRRYLRQLRWSGQWLHWATADQDGDDECPADLFETIRAKRRDHEKPPAYYAVLMMDGDGMGDWLAGKRAPRVREVYHLTLIDYFGSLPDGDPVRRGLDARRPVGPAMHAAISTALANFAVRVVPEVVEQHQGTLIYAGGDDVLALLPARTALRCALDLRAAFRGEAGDGAPPGYVRLVGRDLVMMGPRATLSAGLAVVHYKEDLRFALQAARDAEKRAKAAGKDLLELVVCRRSGGHGSGPVPWDMIPAAERLAEAFAGGASDRWTYHLRAEQEILGALPAEAIRAEIRRVVNRAEDDTRRRLVPDGDAAGHLAGLFDRYRAALSSPDRQAARSGRAYGDADALRDFVTLCQGASFLARGRED